MYQFRKARTLTKKSCVCFPSIIPSPPASPPNILFATLLPSLLVLLGPSSSPSLISPQYPSPLTLSRSTKSLHSPPYFPSPPLIPPYLASPSSHQARSTSPLLALPSSHSHTPPRPSRPAPLSLRQHSPPTSPLQLIEVMALMTVCRRRRPASSPVLASLKGMSGRQNAYRKIMCKDQLCNPFPAKPYHTLPTYTVLSSKLD